MVVSVCPAGAGPPGGDVQPRVALRQHQLGHQGPDHGRQPARHADGELLRLQLPRALHRQRARSEFTPSVTQPCVARAAQGRQQVQRDEFSDVSGIALVSPTLPGKNYSNLKCIF